MLKCAQIIFSLIRSWYCHNPQRIFFHVRNYLLNKFTVRISEAGSSRKAMVWLQQWFARRPTALGAGDSWCTQPPWWRQSCRSGTWCMSAGRCQLRASEGAGSMAKGKCCPQLVELLCLTPSPRCPYMSSSHGMMLHHSRRQLKLWMRFSYGEVYAHVFQIPESLSVCKVIKLFRKKFA